MDAKGLSQLIVEYSFYCQKEYQPHKLPHLTMDRALEFMNEMMQSLTAFAMWIDTVKLKET